MAPQSTARRIDREEVETMQLEERVGKLEAHVAHIQSDIQEMKQDIREIRRDVSDLKVQLVEQGEELRAETAEQGKNLRAEISSLRIAFEQFKGRISVTLAVLIVMQALTLGGLPTLLAKFFKWM